MTRIKTALLALSGVTALAVPAALMALPAAQAWDIGPWVRGRNYSVGMPAHPTPVRGGVAFEFPQPGGQIDAMTTDVRSLAGARQVTMRYRIDAAPGTRFVAEEAPELPAWVSLYFQRRGDNWSARGRYASYRWYVPDPAVIPLSPGVHSVTVRFDEPWFNVNGTTNVQDPQGFAAAIQDTAQIGIAFGSQAGRSHGVYATGPARFTLLGFDVE